MNKLERCQKEFRRVDELSRLDTPIHNLHPLSKLITTMFFLVVLLSFPRTESIALLPLFIYPLFIATAANIPWDFLFWRVLLVSPFVFFLALSSLFFEAPMAVSFFGLKLPLGTIVFLNVLLKFFLSVLAATLLIATTGWADLGKAVAVLPLPKVFVNQLLFLYRYMDVFLSEVLNTVRAYSLRSSGNGLKKAVWGSLLGQILLRTLNRAENIHKAMLMRGFNGELRMVDKKKLVFWDVAYVLVFCSAFFFLRFVKLQ